MEVDGTIFDASALALTTANGELLGWLSEFVKSESEALGNALEKYGKFAAAANIILAYAKLITTYATLDERRTFTRLALSGDAAGSQSSEYSALKSYMRGCQALNPTKKEVRSEMRGSSSAEGANSVSDKRLSISFSPDGKSYEIVFQPAGVELKGQTTDYVYDADGCLPHAKRQDLTQREARATYGLEDFRLKGTLDPDEPNTLRGSFSKVRVQDVFATSVQTSLLITWELSACR